MNVQATPRAAETVRRVKALGRENLVMVLSSGCCDSTAPFLYDNYLPEATAEPVGELEGVPILAPDWIRTLYPEGEGLTVDIDDGVTEDSFSLETDLGCRFVLRART